MNEEVATDELSFYDQDQREKMMEDDEISAEEAGFMQGYEEADTVTLDE